MLSSYGSLAPLAATPATIAGIARLQATYGQSGECQAPNAACVQLLHLTSANGDPGDKRAFFDVKRMSDGGLANKQFINGLKAQAAAEALYRAGVTTPFLGVAKDWSTGVNPHVAIGAGSDFSSAAYDLLSLDKQTPWSGAVSTAPTADPLNAGNGAGQYSTFSNGVSIVATPLFTDKPGLLPLSAVTGPAAAVAAATPVVFDPRGAQCANHALRSSVPDDPDYLSKAQLVEGAYAARPLAALPPRQIQQLPQLPASALLTAEAQMGRVLPPLTPTTFIGPTSTTPYAYVPPPQSWCYGRR